MMSATTMNGTGSVQSGDDGAMDSSHPRAGGPSRRRSFTPAQKLEHVAAYEAACQTHEGGAYLRRQGLYCSDELVSVATPERQRRHVRLWHTEVGYLKGSETCGTEPFNGVKKRSGQPAGSRFGARES